MCGIIGIISSKKINMDKLIRMRDTLIHRGPDDEGIYLNTEKNVALGHRRLSIIDLSKSGKQPMSNEDGTIWITLNGEIYNYKEIKEVLLKFGHKFHSLTDTEVIIHGYEEWGIKILEHLRGMFAFGIWDENKKELILVRDRLGIKPLYYYYDNEKFIFASEIKGIVEDETIPRKINPQALKYYLKYTYIPAPYSIWENIYKLTPAHYLILKNNKITVKKYWNFKLSNRKVKDKILIKNIEKILKESVEYRFVSDVPVGILLSGGLDSSIITALGSEIKKELLSFSIGFELEEYSELKYARIVSNKFKTKSIEKILDSRKMKSLLDKILYYYDEPLGVSSVFPTFLLMEAASQCVKVTLSGDGGDEVFAGYTWYYDYIKNQKYYFHSSLFKPLYYLTSKFFGKINNKILKIVFKKLKYFSLNEFDRYRMLTTPRFEESEIKNLFNNNFLINCKNDNILLNYAKKGLRNIKDLQIFDMNTFLVDSILVKVDRASMAHSLEVRVPFLDHLLIEYIMTLSPNIIFKNYEKKHILKKFANKLLPYQIIYRKKKGFSAPIQILGIIDDNLHVLRNPHTVKDGILNIKAINKLIQNKEENYAKLWLLILFELWYRKWKN